MLSCTLLSVFVCFGRLQGGVYRIMTMGGDNDVRLSSVQGERERTASTGQGVDEDNFSATISEKKSAFSEKSTENSEKY